MSSDKPAFLIHEAASCDNRRILGLARELDSINLPTDSAELRDILKRSELSFRGRIRDRSRAVYVFCAENTRTRSLVGASMIIGKHGTPDAPHYYLEMDFEERYSQTLKRMFRHEFLRLRRSMDGPTEIGGLIVDPSMRGLPEQVGKQLSWVRFLYLARHRKRFEARVIAEMLPPFGPDHRNAFWDHYGREITGLSFREADRLSSRDKEFIQALFPKAPLYIFLLPEEVRNSLGEVGKNTRGAVRLLEKAGMRFLNQLDPFDAGPYYGAEVSELVPVKEYRSRVAICGDPPPDESRWFLVAREDARGFRAMRAEATIVKSRIVVRRAVLRMLSAREGERLDVVPLP